MPAGNVHRLGWLSRQSRAATTAPNNHGGNGMGKSVRIDDIPADGIELTEDELANLIGGLPPSWHRSSKTINIDPGYTDTDEDF
ncbi:putative ATP-grasp target RiPP [Micromonospora sp. NPDC002717]|uniref:putative ATP-grasp target RiPP n=1 Tax=Micromonospora sp. NPDC002717 TaxID=3154424 RepID=UPI00331CF342